MTSLLIKFGGFDPTQSGVRVPHTRGEKAVLGGVNADPAVVPFDVGGRKGHSDRKKNVAMPIPKCIHRPSVNKRHPRLFFCTPKVSAGPLS